MSHIIKIKLKSTHNLQIARTFQNLDLSKLDIKEKYAQIQMNNVQILAIKFLYLSYRLLSKLGIEYIQHLLTFSVDKREVL